MKFILFIACWFCFGITSIDIEEIRKGYIKAIKSKTTTKKYLKHFQTNKPANPLEACYKGVFYCLRARHSVLPGKKVSYLQTGLVFINDAVGKSPGDLEIRFHRFAAEKEIPGFIKYKNNTVSDKQFIVENYDPAHPFADFIYKYMIGKGGCKASDFKGKE